MELLDVCKDCIKHTPIATTQCYQCGCETMEMEWKDCLIIGNCTNCGGSIVGATFWPTCIEDDKEYSLIIGKQELDKAEVIQLSKLLGIRALEMKEILCKGKRIKQAFSHRKILPILQHLEKEGIAYELEPQLQYSEIWECASSPIGKG